MTDSLRGGLGPPILGGYLLDKAAVFEQDFTERKLKEVATLARGGRRETYAYQGAGYPLIGKKHDLVLRYENVRTHHDLIEEILAVPGPHDVVVWKRTHLVYVGNGARREFNLPWRVATHASVYEGDIPPSLSSVDSLARLQVEVRAAIDGTNMTIVEKTQGDYDAGTPGAGIAWFVDGGQVFKVGTIPTNGQRVYVRLVPVLEMFEAPEVQRKYPAATLKEARDIQLMEQ